MNTEKSPKKNPERSREREKLNGWLDEQLDGILEEDVLKRLSLPDKFNIVRRLYGREQDRSYARFIAFLRQYVPDEESLAIVSEDVTNAPENVRDAYRRYLLNSIPPENLLTYLKAPHIKLDTYPELKKNVQDAEESGDIDTDLVPIEILQAYMAKGGSQRFFAFHASTHDMRPDAVITPGSTSEAVPNLPLGMPESGWTWYTYDDVVFGNPGNPPPFVYIVEAYPSDFDLKTNYHEAARNIMGIHRPLKILNKIRAKEDPTFFKDMGLRVLIDVVQPWEKGKAA